MSPHMSTGNGNSIYRTLVPWILTKVLRQLPKIYPAHIPMNAMADLVT
jgi:hypothetical protein